MSSSGASASAGAASTAAAVPHPLSDLAAAAAGALPKANLAETDFHSDPDDEPLYAARKKIYPQQVSGTFRRLKWALLVITLGIYYFLPFIRWDRGPNAPNQAVLIDFPGRRFY